MMIDVLFEFLTKNSEWFFSGLGVTIIGSIFGFLYNFYTKQKKDIPNKTNSLNIQVSELVLGKKSPIIQIINRVQNFTGRQKELELLKNGLMPGRVVFIYGIGGVGKTVLASEALWSICPHCNINQPPENFPDGIVYFSFNENENESIYAFEHIVRSFNEKAIDTSKNAAYRYLSNKKLLLILDNAEKAGDIHSLVDIRCNCCVLILSRKINNIDESDLSIELKVFDYENSVLYLQSICDNVEKTIVKEVCQYIGGLPFALRIAASNLRTNENVIEYTKWLKNSPLDVLSENNNSSNLSLLIEKNLDAIEGEYLKEIFAIFGVLSFAPCSKTLLKNVLKFFKNADDISIHKSINQLYNYGILDKKKDSNYYILSHPLMHKYLSENYDVHNNLLKIILDYYLSFLKSSLQIENIKELINEKNQLIHAFYTAINYKFFEESIDLAWELYIFLFNSGDLLSLQNIITKAIEISIKTNSKRFEGVFINLLGNLYYDFGNINKSKENYEKAIKIFEKYGNNEDLCSSYENLGNLFNHLGNRNDALLSYNKALELSKRIEKVSYEVSILLDIGNVYYNFDLDKALEYYDKAMVICDNSKFLSKSTAAIYNCYGNVYWKNNKFDLAEKYYYKSLQINKKNILSMEK